MKRWLLAAAFVLCLGVPAFATSYQTLATDFAQGGNPTKTKAIIGSGQLYTGPCRIISVNYYAATAGSTVGIYDTVDTRYPITDLEFELGTSANTCNAPAYHPNGPFLNGIRVLSTLATAVTTVVFDY